MLCFPSQYLRRQPSRLHEPLGTIGARFFYDQTFYEAQKTVGRNVDKTVEIGRALASFASFSRCLYSTLSHDPAHAHD
jgi:hypothetical protein